MKAKIAIRFGGHSFLIAERYSDAQACQSRYPNATLTPVWETTDVADTPLDDIIGRLGDYWYIKREVA